MDAPMEEEGSMRSRTSYIAKIISKLELMQNRNKLIPTAAEQTLFHEAITHVLDVVTPPIPAPAIGEAALAPKSMDRKQCLKNILDQLHWMERKRFYDPHADNEIQHHLLIEKYTRSILAFHLALRTQRSTSQIYDFGCPSLFVTLRYVENLMEVNQQLADWTERLLEMNIEDVPSMTTFMRTNNGCEMVCKIGGSKERNYMFYHHKFKLALKDLRSSKLAHCPPLKDEERCYVQVFNAISSSLIEAEDETNVYSEELLNLYLEMILQETVEIERNFAKIKIWILKCLSLTDWWEVVADKRDQIYYDENDIEYYDYEDDDKKELVVFRKELSEKCKVSNDKMRDYIYQVDRCISFAFIVEAFLYPGITARPSYHIIKSVLHKLKRRSAWAWELLFGLNLLKQGPLQLNSGASRKKEGDMDIDDENIIILEKMIDDLRGIGEYNSNRSDAHAHALDDEEIKLVQKICGSVASASHFFVSAMAYEQRRCLIDEYKTFGVSSVELARTKGDAEVVVDSISTSTRLEWRQDGLERNLMKFVRDLKAYRRGLIENKLARLN